MVLILEVVLRDMEYNKFFRGKANTEKTKELELLINTLQAKGVDLKRVVKGMAGGSSDDWFN